MVSVTLMNASNIADCVNGEAILSYATFRGVKKPRLVKDGVFGWHLVGDEVLGQGAVSVAAREMQCSVGGGSTGWHQINPALFSDPRVRAEQLLNKCLDAIQAGDPIPDNVWDLSFDEHGNIVTNSCPDTEFIVLPSDSRTELVMGAYQAETLGCRP